MVQRQTKPFRGVFAIPATPFDIDGEIDELSLRREIDFCVASGVHGIVAPVMVSEFQTLRDEERVRITEIVAEQTAGRIPVVIGISGVSRKSTVMYGRHAARAGADAVIAMPPYVARTNENDILAYYAAIADVVDVPIFVQNAGPPLGSGLSIPFLLRLVREIPAVQYIKEELSPSNHRMSELLAAREPNLLGVFGGMGGRFILDELRRGSAGVMPACQFADVIVQVYEHYSAEDQNGAVEIFERLLPGLIQEGVLDIAAIKMGLRRRGVIHSVETRLGLPALDADDLYELERILTRLQPYLRIPLPRDSGGGKD